jgi:aspartokinase
VTSTRELVEIATPNQARAVLAVLQSQGVALRELAMDLLPGRSASDARPTEQALQASFVRDDLPDFAHTLRLLQDAAAGSLLLREELGSVTAVGPGLGSSPQALARVDASLTDAGLHATRYRQSGLCLTVYLPRAEVAQATQIVHDLLCREASPRSLVDS